MTTVGFIGLGLIGAKRFAIARDLGCRIAFAVEPDPARRQALGAEGCQFVSDIAELEDISAGQLDAVFIAVPHDLAYRSCLWALDRHAHVLCEKPMGLNPAEARTIRSRASSASRKFCAGFNFRFLPGVVALRQLLRQSALGEIHRARIMMAHGGRPGMEREWKLEKARSGGGALIDPGVHLIDLARNLLGDGEVVDCRLSRRFWDADVEDNCSLRLQVGRVDVTIDVGLTSWKNLFSIEIFGSDGIALLTGRGGNYGPQKLEFVNRWFWNGDDRRNSQTFADEDSTFYAETTAFLEWMRSGSLDDTLATADDGVAALDIVGCCYRDFPPVAVIPASAAKCHLKSAAQFGSSR